VAREEGLAGGGAKPYLGAMPLPRPSSPRALIADIRAFTAQRSRVQWAALALAIVMPLGLVFVFIIDGRTNIQPGPQVIYADSWTANRTDAEIVADQKIHQAKREAAIKERQRQFQKVDRELDRLGI
jgi:hypothetical protein